MPAYHSRFLESKQPVLSGFATPQINQRTTLQYEEGDLIDEAVLLFRPNAYLRNFELRGPADRTLAYLLLFIGDALARLRPGQPLTKQDRSNLSLWASSGFALPGDAQLHGMKAMFQEPKGREEADALREWLGRARVETLQRLLTVVYKDQQPSEWWMAFQKRRFMGKTLGSA